MEDGKYYLLSSGEKKNKMRFQEVEFLEAAEFQFCTHMMAVAATMGDTAQNQTVPVLWLPMGLNSPTESEFHFSYFIFLCYPSRISW